MLENIALLHRWFLDRRIPLHRQSQAIILQSEAVVPLGQLWLLDLHHSFGQRTQVQPIIFTVTAIRPAALKVHVGMSAWVATCRAAQIHLHMVR